MSTHCVLSPEPAQIVKYLNYLALELICTIARFYFNHYMYTGVCTRENKMQTSLSTTRSSSLSLSAGLQIASAILLGMVLLYGVGFASSDVAHNAAHDSRHTFAFPCH